MNGLKLVAHFFFDEQQLTHILKHLPDEDKVIRPMLQEGGEWVFGWNR